METDGGAKGAAGGRQTPEGCLPAAWHQGPCQWGIPSARSSATHTCSGGQVWQANRQRRCSSPKPGVRQPRGWLWSPHLPFSGERRLKPTLRRLLSQTPRTVGRRRTKKWGGAHPRLAHTHRSGCSRRASWPVCSAAASPPALAGSPPSSARSPPTSPPSPGPRPHSRSQVQLPGSTPVPSPPLPKPPSAPAPDPDHSRHPASSLKFWNSAGRNSGRLDRSERGLRSSWKEE